MNILKIAIGLVLTVVVLTLLSAAVLNGREQARRSDWMYRLKEIGLALHNYHDVYNCLPPGGIYSEAGQGYQGWPSRLAQFQTQTPFSAWVDDRIPWDDPRQIEWFTMAHCREGHLWQDPGLTLTQKNTFPLIHAAANSWVMHRNSHVTLQDVGDLASTMLAADASEPFDVYGSTTAWRDASIPINSSPLGFSSHGRLMTHCLMADATVRSVDVNIDASIWKQMQAPESLRPAEKLTDRVPGIPPAPTHFDRRIWTDMFHKDIQRATLTADGHHLILNTESVDPCLLSERREDVFQSWLIELAALCAKGNVQSAKLYRYPSPEEVKVLLSCKNLKTVDIHAIRNTPVIRPLLEQESHRIKIIEAPDASE
ncbi:hypothetical protein Spb1_03280 [Planctopirus ephydatiae]|uniref:DUF1559 domain-containing protein n=1 Tax=Planctopirus ephydatiae TaxID=2528019 RepID=A0A518GIP7_9PLAN|nr:DUF1559 domain-containing protein [Planctopirus ephydatiae]QDV28465.1 hypothetical protein Spb1_03280 [Planctopirus ephydatiae]